MATTNKTNSSGVATPSPSSFSQGVATQLETFRGGGNFLKLPKGQPRVATSRESTERKRVKRDFECARPVWLLSRVRKLQVTQFPRQPENATVFQARLMPHASCASSGISCQLALGSPASSAKAGRTWVQLATPSSLTSSLPPSLASSLPSSLHSFLSSSLPPSLPLFIPVTHRVDGYNNFVVANYVCYK